MCCGKYLVGLALSAVFAVSVCDLRGEELYYHTDTCNSSVTIYTAAGYPKAVKFDLPVSSQTYEITSFGVLSQGTNGDPFPADTQIAVRVWDSSGTPLYTSDPFDLSGKDGSVAMRWFSITSDHVQVLDSFYAGFQEVSGGMNFGYKVDLPSGSNYGRSYRYKVSDGTWSALTDDDIWFNTIVSAVPEPSTIVLLVAGLASFLFVAWRQRKRS